ncbi:MAG TPA: hypothetical protein VFO55_12600 [Gemmatimonadaceae bacterium]|nr:hypothetical protein [Gemmatimonadaceae bacterium]
MLIAIAAIALALAVVGRRSVSAATIVAARQVPASDVQSLAAFLEPLPDTASLARVRAGAMVVDRDPLAAAARIPSARIGTPAVASRGARPAEQGGRWVVSSILIEESRRSAIVNNAWVTVGDPLDGGARVTAIERKHVVVTDANGIRHVLPIRGGDL